MGGYLFTNGSFIWKSKRGLFDVLPDFIVEIKSKTDSLVDLQKKMVDWMKNGARLGWLVSRRDEKVYVYKGENEVAEISGFSNTLSGGNVLDGFFFQLSDLRLD